MLSFIYGSFIGTKLPLDMVSITKPKEITIIMIATPSSIKPNSGLLPIKGGNIIKYKSNQCPIKTAIDAIINDFSERFVFLNNKIVNGINQFRKIFITESTKKGPL